MRLADSRCSFILVLMATLAVALTLGGCGSSPASVDEPDETGPDAVQDAGEDAVDIVPGVDVPVPDAGDDTGEDATEDVPMTDGGPPDAIVVDVIEPECLEGQTREFVCEDGTSVPFCICVNNVFECVDSPESQCPSSSFCGDGSELECDEMSPLCETGTTPAIRNGCWECILDELCPENVVFCDSDLVCGPGETCVECATSSCPACADCVAACLPRGCGTEEVVLCNALRPECVEGQVAIVRDGCWLCVDGDTCEPSEELPWIGCESNNDCDIAEECAVGPDGSRFCADSGCISDENVLCFVLPPICAEGETRIGIGGCWACVAVDTCMRFGELCEDDQTCPPGGFCGCPDGVDCFSPVCVESACETQAFIGCRALRPDCGPNGVAVAEDGCWACKDRDTCEPTRGG